MGARPYIQTQESRGHHTRSGRRFARRTGPCVKLQSSGTITAPSHRQAWEPADTTGRGSASPQRRAGLRPAPAFRDAAGLHSRGGEACLARSVAPARRRCNPHMQLHTLCRGRPLCPPASSSSHAHRCSLRPRVPPVPRAGHVPTPPRPAGSVQEPTPTRGCGKTSECRGRLPRLPGREFLAGRPSVVGVRQPEGGQRMRRPCRGGLGLMPPHSIYK